MRAAKCYRRLFTYVTTKCQKKPAWMGDNVYEQWMKIREDPTFIAKSEQAKKNRRRGSMSNPVEASHFQGSITATEHALKLVRYTLI